MRTRRTFFLQTSRGDLDEIQAYEPVLTELFAEGPHCRIWGDISRNSGEGSSAVEDWGNWLDLAEEVASCFRTAWGPHQDIDFDGKIGVVITPRLNGFRGGQTSLKGLVNPNDWDAAIPRPFGNSADVVYVNPDLKSESIRKTILTHELCHAWTTGMRSAQRCSVEDDWLNEGVAHWAEQRLSGDWSNLDFRISRFLNEPERYPLTVPNFYHSPYWREHGCRGAGFLFLRFLVDSWGEEFVEKLLLHPHAGQRKCAQLTGLPFDELFRLWTVWLATWENRSSAIAPDSASPRFEFAGPQPHELCLDARENSGKPTDSTETLVSVRGMAAAFFEFKGEPSGAYHVQIEALPMVSDRSSEREDELPRFQVTWLRNHPHQNSAVQLMGNESPAVSDTPNPTNSQQADSHGVIAWEQHDRDFHASGYLPLTAVAPTFTASEVRPYVSRPDLPVVLKQIRVSRGRRQCRWMTLPASDHSAVTLQPIPHSEWR